MFGRIYLDWRRWLTALSVLLVATLYLEPAHAADQVVPCHAVATALAVADAGVAHTHHADVTHEHHDDATDHDGADPHVHSCGGAHTACFPAATAIGAREEVALDVAIRRPNAARASHLTFGLERPPRTHALA